MIVGSKSFLSYSTNSYLSGFVRRFELLGSRFIIQTNQKKWRVVSPEEAAVSRNGFQRTGFQRRLPLVKLRDSSGNSANDEEQPVDDNGLDGPSPPLPLIDLEGSSVNFCRADVEALTITQLKQQLRLRGLKVSGRKQELLERLLKFVDIVEKSTSKPTGESFPDGEHNESKQKFATVEVMPSTTKSKARQFAEARGKELIDVTPYLDEADKGKQVKSSIPIEDDEDDELETANGKTDDGTTEVWGSQARIVDDYEGRSVVVDNLSRAVVEFQGSNQESVQAFCVASRDALKGFLAGRAMANSTTTNQSPTIAENRLYEIQKKREQAAKLPLRRGEEQEGLDEGDETGLYANILERDFSDWGKFTATGAQLSAQEVQGVLLLSDVYGPLHEDNRALAEKIAFECQPVVVMAPDLFRGRPWNDVGGGKNEIGQTYEEWRASHSDLRVSVDIRAAAACLRESYQVSCIAVWGVCYGGGRALEAAAGHLPNGSIHDVNGEIGPPPVDPSAVIAWYPTRYNAEDLFGKYQQGSTEGTNSNNGRMAVMAIFAGDDTTPGATPDDATTLNSLLKQDTRVKDHVVKVFPNQRHGFAHQGLSKAQQHEDDSGRFVNEEFGGSGRLSIMEGDAEVACLLSTAWMETYTRIFLPTVGPPISQDESASKWSDNLEIDLSYAKDRDIRQEIEEAIETFVEEPLSGYRIDQTDESQQAELAALLRKAQNRKTAKYPIDADDDLMTIYAKLKASDENFQIF